MPASVAFYNQRGTAEQWIKEGKGAIKWTWLSCRSIAAQRCPPSIACPRLHPRQFHADAGDPQGGGAVVADQKLIKIRPTVASHGPPRNVPDGRSRGIWADVRGYPAAHRPVVGATRAA